MDQYKVQGLNSSGFIFWIWYAGRKHLGRGL